MTQHNLRLRYLVFLALFSILSCFGQDSLPANRVPADILFKKRLLSDYCISPDGKLFAETLKNNLETDLIIVDIDKNIMLDRIPLGKISVQNLYWLGDKRLLYEAEGEIYAIDTDGANATLIVNRMPEKFYKYWNSFYKNFRYNNVLSLLPAQKDEILIETYDFEVYATAKRVNIFTGEKYVVASGKRHKMNKWFTDFNGKVKLGIRAVNKGMTFMEFNPESGEWEPLTIYLDGQGYPLEISGNSYLNQNINFEGFTYEPDVIFLSSNVNTNRRRLVKYHLKKKQLVEDVIEDVNCDISDPHGAEVKIIHDYKNATIAGYKYEGILPEYIWESKEFESAYNALGDKYRLMVHDIIDVDAANNRFLVHQWSDNYAGNIGVYTAANSTYTVMHQLNEELNKFELSRSRSIVFTTRDNYRVQAYLSLPVNTDPDSNVPLVVLPHGGPWSRDYWEFDRFSHYFTSRGYATLKVNFRGSTGLGKEHVLAGVKGINTVMIDDIADGVLHVNKNYPVDSRRVFLYGHSYGGYATYLSLIRYPSLYASGVAVSAPSDIKSWMRHQRRENNDFAYEFWKAALGTKSGRDLSEISPINRVGQITKPILIAHGERDGIIPVEQAKEMVEKLRDEQKDVRSKMFQTEGHSGWDTNNTGYLLDLSYDFFREFDDSSNSDLTGK
jgi:pimeloyl-ACP methyl ester carboxylesterase